MKLNCHRDYLIPAVRNASRIAQMNLAEKQIKLSALGSGNLEIQSFSGENHLIIKIPAQVTEPGQTILANGPLNSFLAETEKGKIELYHESEAEGTGFDLTVKSGTYCGSFNGYKKFVGPLPHPDEDYTEIARLDSQELKLGISRTLFAAATEASRPVLTGINLVAEGSEFLVAAADGFRLAYAGNYSLYEHENSFLIPAPAMKELLRLLSDYHDEVEIWKNLNQDGVVFRLTRAEAEVRYEASTISGKYPKYGDLIPEKHTTSAMIWNPEQSLKALKASLIFSKPGSGAAVLEIEKVKGKNGGRIRITGKSEEVGEAEIILPCKKITGLGNRVKINIKYLTEALGAFGKNPLNFSITEGGASPVLLCPTQPEEGNQNHLHLIMPFFTQSEDEKPRAAETEENFDEGELVEDEKGVNNYQNGTYPDSESVEVESESQEEKTAISLV